MSAPAEPRDAGATVSPWRGAGPELVIAVVSIVVAAAATVTATDSPAQPAMR